MFDSCRVLDLRKRLVVCRREKELGHVFDCRRVGDLGMSLVMCRH